MKTTKYTAIRFLGFICSIVFVFAISIPNASRAQTFAYGADIGWVSQYESLGVTWQNSSGTAVDVLQLLKDRGVNSIRLRVFVNPPASGYVGDFPLGYCDPTSVVSMAVRAKNKGFRILIDFHYSDVWADPGHQAKPAAWSTHTFSQLKTDVYNHTFSVMTSLVNAGVYPEWVQVGNEITSGMLLPDGSTSNFSQLAQLITSGYNAVKAVNPSSQVIVHLDNGHANSVYRWFFDNLVTYGVNWDIIGMTAYAAFGTDIASLKANLNDMASRYGKPVMVVETGGDETNPYGEQSAVSDTMDAVKSVPNSKGLGVFYWEPEGHSSLNPRWTYCATTQITTKRLAFTAAMDNFTTGALVKNGDFERDFPTQTASQWSTWANGTNSDADYTESTSSQFGFRHLAHWKSSAYQIYTYQDITLPNGSYTLRAWVKSSGGQIASAVVAKNYGGAEIDYNINTSIPNWTLVTMTFNVTAGFVEIGFWSNANANNWINVDNVSLTKN